MMNTTAPIVIVTHSGNAHRDEFLACGIIMSQYQNRHIVIHRRDPMPSELDSPDIFVIDVGRRHEPELKNFDHHQFERGTLSCALSLVLDDLGVLTPMKENFSWLEVTERLDCTGPKATAEFLGLEPEGFFRALSPVEEHLLWCFSDRSVVRYSPLVEDLDRDWLGDAMMAIGSSIMYKMTALQERLRWLQKYHALLKVQDDLWAIYVPRGEDGLENPELGMHQLRTQLIAANPGIEIAISITPDSRGDGHILYRYEDHPRVDFTLISQDPELGALLEFVANTGFIAKTHDELPTATLIRLAQAAVLAEEPVGA